MINVFFDVDGCLIGHDYNPNIDPIIFGAKMNVLSKEGYIFHINSNRSIEDLIEIYEEFGFNGEMIIENGTSCYNPKTGKSQSYGFETFDRSKLFVALENSLSEVSFVKTNKLIKDPVKFVRFFKDKDEKKYFCEETRKYTMTIYPRLLKNSLLFFNQELLDDTLKKLVQIFPDYTAETGLDYGNILLVPRNAHKGSLMSKVANSGKIVSFGDGEADISMFQISDFCGAPKNSGDKVKKKVQDLQGYVSPFKFTKGAYDFLLNISRKF